MPMNEWWRLLPGAEKDPHQPAHAGLYLDRCLPLSEPGDKEKKARKQLYENLIHTLNPNQPGRAAWDQRRRYILHELLRPIPNHEILSFVVKATSRMLLHPATGQTVTDGSVLLHHSWGVPYLPGSGLKGLARAGAHRHVVQNTESAKSGVVEITGSSEARKVSENTSKALGSIEEDLQHLFGPEPQASDHRAGIVQFLDALWLPGKESPLCLEVVTPHHSRYYTADAEYSLAEEPVPTQRLAIEAGTEFQVILQVIQSPDGQGKEWLEFAKRFLSDALSDLGFSAWTASGMGRMVVVGEERSRMQAGPAPAAEWPVLALRWDAGKGKLSGSFTGGVAEAVSTDARRIFDGLSAEIQARLKKGAVNLPGRVEKQGNRLVIMELRQG